MAEKDTIAPRVGTMDDVEAMTAIEHAAGGHGRWEHASFVQELRCAWSHTWVLQGPHRVVGFMVVWRVADEAHLLNIAVDPGYRRQGLARALLGHLRSWSQAQGLTKVLLELREHNTGALRLYESCGFVPTGQRPLYYTDTGEDALLMECLL